MASPAARSLHANREPRVLARLASKAQTRTASHVLPPTGHHGWPRNTILRALQPYVFRTGRQQCAHQTSMPEKQSGPSAHFGNTHKRSALTSRWRSCANRARLASLRRSPERLSPGRQTSHLLCRSSRRFTMSLLRRSIIIA